MFNMHWMSIFRICVFAWAIFCSLLLLGLGGHALSATGTLQGLPAFAWAGLSVATAVLTLVTLVPMLAIDFLRKGAFTSMIVVELSVLGFLGVLFLAAGGSAAGSASAFWLSGCGDYISGLARTVCGETSAAAAFGFLGWFAIWGYTWTLAIMLIIQARNRNYIWLQSVKAVNWNAQGANVPPVGAPGMYVPEVKEGMPLGQPDQLPYGYPPAMTPQQTGYNQGLSPQPTGYSNQGLSPQPTGPYPQV